MWHNGEYYVAWLLSDGGCQLSTELSVAAVIGTDLMWLINT